MEGDKDKEAPASKRAPNLPGTVPKHVERLEDIQDELDSIDGKIAKLREKKNELNAEAVGIWKEHNVEPMVRGSNEWFLKEPTPKMSRRRPKVTKEKEDKATAADSAKRSRKAS